MNKNIIYALIASLALFIIYLYTGHKTQLFYIALALIVAIWSKNKNFHYQFFQVFIVGTTLLIILTQISTPLKGLFGEVYSLLIRRAIFDPAYLKFIHYDYFCNHPKLGLYGAIPRVLIFREIPYYGKNGYAFDIGRIYFGKPQMSADTGALAEGFSRFGYIGIFIIFSLIGVFLRLINAFERKSNTRITLSVFLCPIYSLSEMPLIGGLVFGSYFAFLLILLFYRPERIMVYHSLPKKKKRVAKIKKKAKNRIYLERRCAYGN